MVTFGNNALLKEMITCEDFFFFFNVDLLGFLKAKILICRGAYLYFFATLAKFVADVA